MQRVADPWNYSPKGIVDDPIYVYFRGQWTSTYKRNPLKITKQKNSIKLRKLRDLNIIGD